MYKNKSIGVVVPVHNEEKFIGSVLDTMPVFVDKIYVVNDASTDSSPLIISNKSSRDTRIVMINRKTCGGVGAAILTGHAQALQDGMDVIAVMAGDGQMDPAMLDQFIQPVADGQADYAKGNRLSKQHIHEMPLWRRFGNFILTTLTRISSGYWHVSDPQNGYTAISAVTLRKLDLKTIERGFAFENSMLVNLNLIEAKVVDIPHSAIYRGQQSKIRYGKFIVNTSWILLKDFARRIRWKYFKRK